MRVENGDLGLGGRRYPEPFPQCPPFARAIPAAKTRARSGSSIPPVGCSTLADGGRHPRSHGRHQLLAALQRPRQRRRASASPAPIGLRTSATRGAGTHSPAAVGHRRAGRVGGHDRGARALRAAAPRRPPARAGARRRPLATDAPSPPSPSEPLGLGEVRRHEVGRRVERAQQRLARRVDDRPRARGVGESRRAAP